MLDLRWKSEELRATFYIPEDEENILHVEFERALIVRILDEMPLSTEGDKSEGFEGHAPDHLAYRPQGSFFWRMQSEAFKFSNPSAKHYLFVTGWACLDVISSLAPKLLVAAKDRTLMPAGAHNGN
jgi:hypothetical protein